MGGRTCGKASQRDFAGSLMREALGRQPGLHRLVLGDQLCQGVLRRPHQVDWHCAHQVSGHCGGVEYLIGERIHIGCAGPLVGERLLRGVASEHQIHHRLDGRIVCPGVDIGHGAGDGHDPRDPVGPRVRVSGGEGQRRSAPHGPADEVDPVSVDGRCADGPALPVRDGLMDCPQPGDCGVHVVLRHRAPEALVIGAGRDHEHPTPCFGLGGVVSQQQDAVGRHAETVPHHEQRYRGAGGVQPRRDLEDERLGIPRPGLAAGKRDRQLERTGSAARRQRGQLHFRRSRSVVRGCQERGNTGRHGPRVLVTRASIRMLGQPGLGGNQDRQGGPQGNVRLHEWSAESGPRV